MVVAIIVNYEGTFDPTLIGAQKFYPETGAIKGAFTNVFFHALHHHDAGGGSPAVIPFLQCGRLSRACLPYTGTLVGSRKYTTSHLESLDGYFLLKMCTRCMQAGGGSHVDVMMTSPVEDSP